MENKVESAKKFTRRYDTVFAFLTLELVALTCFGLGGVTGLRIMEILGFFISLFAIPFLRLNYTQEDFKANLKVIIPLGVLFLLIGCSGFFCRLYGVLGNGSFINKLSSIIVMLAESIGLLGFFLLGMTINGNKAAKKDFILYALLGGLALYCVIVGLYSVARYGIFYAARFNGMFYYYKGVLFPVSTEGKMLLGFSFAEVSLKYGCIASILLGSSGACLFAISPKNDRKRFAIFASLSFIGIVYNAVIPYLPGLVFIGISFLFGLVYSLIRRATKNNEGAQKKVRFIFKIVWFVLAGIAAVVILLFLIESKAHLISNLCNAIFHRVPGFVSNTLSVADDVLYNGASDLGKINLGSLLFGYNEASLNVHLTRFFPLNFLVENGLIAFLLLVALVFFAMRNSRDFLAKGEDDLFFRLAVTGMMLAVFLYVCFYADEIPLAHQSTTIYPFSQSNYMMVLMFLFGLSYVPFKAKEGNNHE